MPVLDPLVGCVYAKPTLWPGMAKIEACSEQAVHNLRQHPGVMCYENPRKPDAVGWYVPQSLIDMGRYPALLHQYPPEPHDTLPSGIRLLPHQARTVTFLRQVTPDREGALVAAAPGDGKTISALHALWLDGYLNRRGLVVGPNIAKSVWRDEDGDAAQHYGLKIKSLAKVQDFDPYQLQEHWCFFCSYDILPAWHHWLFRVFKPEWLIIDEIHLVVNAKAARSEALRQVTLAASIERRYGLTGTPLPNSRMDLWHQLATIQPRQWGTNRMLFGIRYAEGQRLPPEQGGHWSYPGESNCDELRARLAGTFLCYSTEDMENSLPPIERKVIDAEFSDTALMAEYAHAQRDVVGYLRMKGKLPDETEMIEIGGVQVKLSKNQRTPGAMQLVCLTTLIGILSEMKREAAVKAILQILAEHDRIVVFTSRTETARWIYEQLQGWIASGLHLSGKRPFIYGPVDGDMKLSRRKELAQEFAQMTSGIYVATTGAAGMAINDLSAASAVLMVDLHWTAKDLRQAEKRVHRTGCTASRVDIYFLVAHGTVDDMFLEKIAFKADAASNVFEADTGGMHLVHALVPDKVREKANIDEFCQRLMATD